MLRMFIGSLLRNWRLIMTLLLRIAMGVAAFINKLES